MQPWYKVHLFHFTRTTRELKLSCNHWVLNTHNTCSNTKETTASKSSGYRAQRGSQLPTAPRPAQKPQVNSSALPTRFHPKFCPQYRQVLLLNEQSAQQPKKVILNINMYLNLRSFVSCFHVNTEFRGNISRKMSKLWKDFITKYFQSKKKKKYCTTLQTFLNLSPSTPQCQNNLNYSTFTVRNVVIVILTFTSQLRKMGHQRKMNEKHKLAIPNCEPGTTSFGILKTHSKVMLW